MNQFLSALSDNAAIIAVAAVVLTLMAVAVTIARNYHNVPPNQVAVVSGRQRKIKSASDADSRRGYRVIRGGGFLLWPVLERVDYMSLNVMSFEVSARTVPDANGVLVSVTGIANVKVLSTEEALPLAIERFLGFQGERIERVAQENLESNLRAATVRLCHERCTMALSVRELAGFVAGGLGFRFRLCRRGRSDAPLRDALSLQLLRLTFLLTSNAFRFADTLGGLGLGISGDELHLLRRVRLNERRVAFSLGLHDDRGLELGFPTLALERLQACLRFDLRLLSRDPRRIDARLLLLCRDLRNERDARIGRRDLRFVVRDREIA